MHDRPVQAEDCVIPGKIRVDQIIVGENPFDPKHFELNHAQRQRVLPRRVLSIRAEGTCVCPVTFFDVIGAQSTRISSLQPMEDATVDRDNPRIRNLRRSKGWTQAQLAARADVSLRTIQFAESGRGTLKLQTLHQIAEALDCDLSELMIDDSVLREDALQRIPWSVSNLLRRQFHLPMEATCRRVEQVEAVLLKMREEWKLHLQRTGIKAVDASYLQADQMLDSQVERYVERYVDLWRHIPQTLQLATDGRSLFGISVVLPLTREAFQAFSRGELGLLDIRGYHLTPASQYLLLDSVCEFSDAPNTSWSQLTSTLSFTMISQIARFSIDPLRDDFQMVSFAASDLNAIRLREAGFRPNGSFAADVQCPVQVFSRVPNGRFSEQYIQSSNMSHIARLTRESWLSGLNRRCQQISFVGLLRFIKWTQELTCGERLDGSSERNADGFLSPAIVS